jgi:hypothetical protein
MVDIASTSSVSNQIQIDRGSSQENTVSVQKLLTKTAEDSSTERKEVESTESSAAQRNEVESSPGLNIGQKVDIRA